MRIFLTLFLFFSCLQPALAESQYFFSPDSPTLVKNRLKMNLQHKNNDDVDILLGLIPSFQQNGDEFRIYGRSIVGKPAKPILLYTATVYGSKYNRTFVHLVSAPDKTELLMSNVVKFMQGVVEQREARVFEAEYELHSMKELRETLLSAPTMKINRLVRTVEEIGEKSTPVFASGNVSDGFHEAKVLQVIADAQALLDSSKATLDEFVASGEDYVINGNNVNDVFRKQIAETERTIARWQQYKRDYLDPYYQVNKSDYKKLKAKLKGAYGYGYSFEKMYSGSYSSTSDGGSVAAGLTWLNKKWQPLLLKFAKDGELQFHRVFSAYPDGDTYFRAITSVEGTNLLGVIERTIDASSASFVTKFAANGDLMWEKAFDNISLNGVIHDPAGFYYAVGRTSSDPCSAVLVKLDLEGNLLSQRLFAAEQGKKSLINGIILSDRSLVFVGYGSEKGDTASRAMMLHLSANDRLLSESYHGTKGSLFHTVSAAPDKSLFVGGTLKEDSIKKAVVVKFDQQGHELWQTTIFDKLKDQDSQVFAIKTKGDDAILVGSAMEYGFVAKLNQKGELLWRDVYGEAEKVDQLKGLCLTPNGKIMVAGQTKSYASMGKQNLWVFELADKPGKVFTAPPKNPEAAFLTENKSKEGVITLASGAQFKILREGTGSTPTYKDIVNLHYHGTFIDGQIFDSTYDRRESLEMEVEYFVGGLQELLQKMKVGCKWQLFIPAALAYGERGRGTQIPPNKTLIYEIELLEVKSN